MIKAEQNGFIYSKITKEIVVKFNKGNNLYIPEFNDIFYGTKEEAIDFGLIFKNENYD
jgi:hypothetical protein